MNQQQTHAGESMSFEEWFKKKHSNIPLHFLAYDTAFNAWKARDAEIDRLKAKLKVAREALVKVQWRGSDEHHNPMCPVCSASHWVNTGKEKFEYRTFRVHKSDCWILRAIDEKGNV